MERAAADPRLRQLALPLAVAFNPYLPDEQRQQEERKRLRRKLEAGRGMVTAIYLQVGCQRLVGMHSKSQGATRLWQAGVYSWEFGKGSC